MTNKRLYHRICGFILLYTILINIYYLNINAFSINNKNNLLPFYEVDKYNFYISNSYYDYRFKAIRIQTAYNPLYYLSFVIKDEENRVLNYSLVLYDKCLKSEKYFSLKFGNIIIESNNVYNSLLLEYKDKSTELKVRYLKKIKKYKITWCMTSLRNYYDAIIQFSETINLAIKYGIKHIIIYYSNISKRIEYLIRKYEKLKIAQSYYFEENIYSCGMKICGKLLQLNDCFLQSIYNSEYILNVDIDEIIIPKIKSNYTALLDWIDKRNPYLNMYIFYTKLCIKTNILYQEDRKSPDDYLNLPKVIDTSIFKIKNCCIVSVLKTACSKYIIKPSMIEAIWLHDVWKGNYNYAIIPPSIAYTRHTRHLSIGLSNVCYNYSTDILIQ